MGVLSVFKYSILKYFQPCICTNVLLLWTIWNYTKYLKFTHLLNEKLCIKMDIVVQMICFVFLDTPILNKMFPLEILRNIKTYWQEMESTKSGNFYIDLNGISNWIAIKHLNKLSSELNSNVTVGRSNIVRLSLSIKSDILSVRGVSQ